MRLISQLLSILSHFQSGNSIFLQIPELISWKQILENVIIPILNVMVALCLVMSVMFAIEALTLAAISVYVKLFGRTPYKRYKWEPIEGEDEELGTLKYPMVLVQIPMFNEREVYKLSIKAACSFTWPSDRMIIQILDDSTDPIIKEMVATECILWQAKGLDIRYEVRENRKGNKAGSLKKGLEHAYVQQCEFVAIFDADFQPDPDFLLKTIPFLVHNPKIALVQARWEFVNYDECVMTRIQKISLDYHFTVEQEAGSFISAFFGFNGTGGVWRISTINEVGGWKDGTTVEDMDLAIRATLKGWDLLFVGDVKVKSELPSTFEAYRSQQHRWVCGPANLFREIAWKAITTKEVSVWKKIYIIYNFFIVRKIVAQIFAFTFYNIMIPVSIVFPEVRIPLWGVMYIPTIILLLTILTNPRSVHLMPVWVLFESVMSMHRIKSTFSGLTNTGNVNEWIVTEKLGNTRNGNGAPVLTFMNSKRKVYYSELVIAIFLLFCASYNLVYAKDNKFVFPYVQASAFIVMGFGFVGTSVSNR